MAMVFVSNDSTASKTDSLSDDEGGAMSEAQASLSAFWPSVQEEIKRIKSVDAKNQALPLARIKKIMKLDEDVKMISAEAPLLFSKAAEIFINELTLRAWVHTEDNKRRTLQRSDIAMAITKYDQFDFLIDIVPRDEIKPPRRDTQPEVTKTASPANTNQVQYYIQVSGQQHQPTVMQDNNSINVVQQGQECFLSSQPQTIQVQTTSNPVNMGQQNILVTTQNGGQQMQTGTLVNAIHQQSNVGHQQQLQLVQQIVSPTGEISHVPIPLTQNQLNALRMQMPHTNNQPILIQASGNVFVNANNQLSGGDD